MKAHLIPGLLAGATGLLLVACGSAVGGGGGAAPPGETRASDSEVAEVEAATPEAANPETDASDAPLEGDPSTSETAEGDAGAAAEAQAEAEAQRLFLPADATVTPFGDAILRGGQTPFFGRGWRTNWDVRIVDLTELISGGPPRDGIPSIDDPVFISLDEASETYPDTAPLIQVEVNGDVRAYPLDILIWHEITNDVVGGEPLAVTFCPLCNTAIAYKRTVEGRTFEFGVSGLLRNSDLIMYDRTTESLWQQIGGKAIIGSMVGARLEAIPAPIVSLGQFRESFPDGIVLSRETGFVRRYGQNPYRGYDSTSQPFLFRGQVDERLDALERVVTLDFEGEQLAYAFGLLSQVRALNDDRPGGPLVVFWTPGTNSALDAAIIDFARDVGATGVFRRELDGRVLTFRPNDADPDGATFVDEETGSVWNIFGQAVEGELAGSSLEALVHANHFWFAWAAFEPETQLIAE